MADSSLSRLRAALTRRAGALQGASIIAAVAFVAWILWTRGDDLRSAFALTPALFALISVSTFATFALNGIELQVLAGRFDRHIPGREGLLLGLMVSTLNYLPMKTGTLLNGVLMRARYRVRLADFGALVAGSTVIHLWVAFACAGAALLVEGGDARLAWALLLAPTAAAALLVVWGRTRTTGRFDAHDSRAVRAAARVVDGLGLIFGSGRLLAVELVINFALVGLAALRTMWAFEALSYGATFSESLVVTAVGIFAHRLSVIPGGIGFKEGGAAAGSAMVGIAASLGLAASVIDRAVMLVWLLIMGVPAALYLQRLTGIGIRDARSMRTADTLPEESA